MQADLKDLIEMCEIEISYARAEVLASDKIGREEKVRVSRHLGNAFRHLKDLVVLADQTEADCPFSEQGRKQIA